MYPDDQPQPTDAASTPNESAEAQGRREDPQQAPETGTSADTATPTVTQGNMGDGSGQRGGYGDSDQTNGMEGGNAPAQDAEQGTVAGA